MLAGDFKRWMKRLCLPPQETPLGDRGRALLLGYLKNEVFRGYIKCPAGGDLELGGGSLLGTPKVMKGGLRDQNLSKWGLCWGNLCWAHLLELQDMAEGAL